MTAAILDNEHKKNSSYSQMQSVAPLNSLSQFVANFDLIDRESKQTEVQSLDLSRMCVCDLDQWEHKNMYDCSEGKIESSKSSLQKSTEVSNESTEEKSTFSKSFKEHKSKENNDTKINFDAGLFMREERRKLIMKLEKSTDDRVIFKKRAKKLRKNAKHDDENYRGSRYWGVSRNKSKYQVMITLNHYKEYNGGFSCEDEAARVYDRKSICTFGLKAKTNFDYSKLEILEILKNDCPIVL